MRLSVDESLHHRRDLGVQCSYTAMQQHKQSMILFCSF